MPPPSPPPPPTPFDRMRNGDPSGLADWVAANRERLKAAAPAYRGQGGDASDVVQDASINLLELCARGFPGIATEGQLLGWLTRVLQNRAVDQYRKNHRLRQAPPAVEGAASLFGQLADLNSLGSVGDLRDERRTCVAACAGVLPDVQYRVVMLREVNGLPLKTVAGAVGLTAVAVAREYYAGVGPVRAALDDLTARALAAASDARRLNAYRGLCSLPVRQRQAVELKHIERPEYKLTEIGPVLDCSPAAAAQLVCRGIEKLGEFLVVPKQS